MTSGWLFLGFSTLICLGVFLNGLRFARMDSNPLAGKSVMGMPVEGSDMPIEKVRLIGKVQMITAPLFLVFAIAMSFGLLGPVDGIETIRLP